MTPRPINKLADYQDLHTVARAEIIRGLLAVRSVLDRGACAYSSPMSNSWLRFWEYSGAILEAGLDDRMSVLDAGGTGTVLSYYAALCGCNVTTIDTDHRKVSDAWATSAKLGLEMEHKLGSVTDMSFPDDAFHRVFCICVIEHLTPEDEQKKAIRELARVLRPGGILALTFDWGEEAADLPLATVEEVEERLVEPSGLEVMGNKLFHADSNDLRDTRMDYTFGALFLRKPGVEYLPNAVVQWTQQRVTL